MRKVGCEIRFADFDFFEIMIFDVGLHTCHVIQKAAYIHLIV